MPLISIFVTSPDTHSERRIDSSLTVSQLKDKLTPITGISPQYQSLTLLPSSESALANAIVQLTDESRTLDSYGIAEWNCIKVGSIDPNARPGEFSDLSAVEKFELTSEEYEARPDTVLSHLKSHKLGRFAPTPTNLTHASPPPSSAPADVIPGARCEITPAASDSSSSSHSHSQGDEGGGLRKRGTVRFVGVAEIGKGGVWVGVELDEPVGKGDGAVEGNRYFTCSPRHAIFVRPDRVTIGDFPEEDLMASDDDEEI